MAIVPDAVDKLTMAILVIETPEFTKQPPITWYSNTSALSRGTGIVSGNLSNELPIQMCTPQKGATLDDFSYIGRIFFTPV